MKNQQTWTTPISADYFKRQRKMTAGRDLEDCMCVIRNALPVESLITTVEQKQVT